DTGPGIPPEDLERVQTPFARGRQPFVRTKEGLGLGLPLAKAFMEAHGGALDVVSNPGKGTTVTLGFPADRVIRP
ncbi:MAG: sensor histidine kinase, partial [Pseudomonadota bacterium]